MEDYYSVTWGGGTCDWRGLDAVLGLCRLFGKDAILLGVQCHLLSWLYPTGFSWSRTTAYFRRWWRCRPARTRPWQLTTHEAWAWIPKGIAVSLWTCWKSMALMLCSSLTTPAALKPRAREMGSKGHCLKSTRHCLGRPLELITTTGRISFYLVTLYGEYL